MTAWNWQRIACIVAATVIAGLGFICPPAAVITTPIAKALIAGAGGFLAGVAVRTPGHIPAVELPPGADLLER